MATETIGPISLRPRQREAVESLAPRITVAAGPGSGKTRVLVERIARGVRDGRLRLDRVLAITFTINAAAEMRVRLASSGLPTVDVDGATIATIHAFCASLLRRYPVEARVDPGLRVLEEIEADVMKQRVMDALLDRIASADPTGFSELALHVRGRSIAETLLNGYREVAAQGGNLDDPKNLLPINDHAMFEHVERVAQTLCLFHAAYRREKDSLSALDFDDLEIRVARLLESDVIAATIGRQYDEILVDEYQDTSRLQAGIVERIVTAGGARLFVVGDPKQSIYSFRNARTENFDEAIARAEACNAAIDLVEDFRSRPEVLAPINEYFKNAENFAGERAYQPLQAAGEFTVKSGPSVEMLVSEGRPEETRRLARAIRALAARGYEYGSIAMLFRSTPDMSMYEQALAAEGVPYYSESGRGYYDTREIVDMVSFLHVLDNDRDEIALAAVLRSPMFGLSDDALYLLAVFAREISRGTRLCDILGDPHAMKILPPIDRGVVARFLAVREVLTEVAVTRPLASLIYEIVRQTGYEDALLAQPGGDRAVANVRKLEEMARVIEASSIGGTSTAIGPGGFADAVDRFREEEAREAEAQVAAAGSAVRMMTMHAAKGLEFPVVVLPDLGRQDASETAQVDFHIELGLGCSYFDVAEGEAGRTPTLDAIRERKKKRNQRESERLLFVAMTRAQDHLLLSGSGKGRNSRYPKLLALNLPAFPLPEEAPAISAVATATFSESPAALLAAPPADQSDYGAAITDVAEFAACARRYYLARYLGFSNEAVAVSDEEEGEVESRTPDEFSASERGTLVHRRLAGDRSGVTQEIEALARRFEESELGKLPNAQHEVPIIGQVEGRVLHGVLDLRAGDIIVDYKTGQADDDRYAVQMQLYGLLTGARQLYLYYLDESRASRVEPDAGVRETVRRFFDAQQSLDFPPVVAAHCGRCPFNGKQCREPEKVRAAAEGAGD